MAATTSRKKLEKFHEPISGFFLLENFRTKSSFKMTHLLYSKIKTLLLVVLEKNYVQTDFPFVGLKIGKPVIHNAKTKNV